MAIGLLGTGASGLQAFQRAIAVVGHNISNANTEGYSRQRVELGTRAASFTGQGFIGNGVQVQSVERLFDQFVTDNLRSTTSSSARYDTMAMLASRVSNLLGDADAGLGAGLESFFNAVQGVADDPASIPARQLLISESDSLVSRFRSLDSQLDALSREVNGSLTNMVSDINGLTSAIADANRRIVDATSQGAGAVPNDLLDKRDALITRLSELVSVRTVEQDDGAVNVFVGTGQPLVTRFLASPLQVERNEFDASRLEIGLVSGGVSAQITEQLTGGRLGATLDFRGQTLDPARNALGQIAVSLATTFNQQHQAGMDLDGNNGAAFFSIAAPEVAGSSANSGSATVTVSYDSANIADLTSDDYTLSYDGSVWSLNRTSDGQTVASGAGPFAVDGLVISMGAGAVAGDRYRIAPTRKGAMGMAAVVSDPRAIAAAAPAASAAPGDNSNARRLADLQTALTMEGGTTDLQGRYGQLIARVGTQTRAAQTASEAQAALLSQAQESRDALSGVNLDEEAANLLRFQQAYQAVAQVISVANSTFQTLLNAVGR
ncbi:MAG TPA: flagellar hook-associated protein FlgK [Gammaproteobacteria bacterium]|nr:flagellar hook-associated protein FlgK [Gammaproteobacteria bacterium]